MVDRVAFGCRGRGERLGYAALRILRTRRLHPIGQYRRRCPCAARSRLVVGRSHGMFRPQSPLVYCAQRHRARAGQRVPPVSASCRAS